MYGNLNTTAARPLHTVRMRNPNLRHCSVQRCPAEPAFAANGWAVANGPDSGGPSEQLIGPPLLNLSQTPLRRETRQPRQISALHRSQRICELSFPILFSITTGIACDGQRTNIDYVS